MTEVAILIGLQAAGKDAWLNAKHRQRGQDDVLPPDPGRHARAHSSADGMALSTATSLKRLRRPTVPVGVRTIVRVDGRAFSGFTEKHFDKPFDGRFSDLMVETTQALLTEFDARYAYTESDEISFLLNHDVFGRSVEKIVSISAGLASAAFTHAAGVPAHFDSRIWIGAGTQDVVDYFSWRQSDATRCALNGWCYWTLRKAGASRPEATRRLHGTTTADKNELLHQHGVNFNDLPAWQRRGIGLWWENYDHTGHDPVRDVDVTTTRRRVRVDRELPMKDGYRALVDRLVSG